jgi:hypothetical protein
VGTDVITKIDGIRPGKLPIPEAKGGHGRRSNSKSPELLARVESSASFNGDSAGCIDGTEMRTGIALLLVNSWVQLATGLNELASPSHNAF